MNWISLEKTLLTLQLRYLAKKLTKLELLLISVIMRIAVINSLFGLLANYNDLVVLYKIIYIFLKIRVTFSIRILLLG
jgi:hypothetical protein